MKTAHNNFNQKKSSYEATREQHGYRGEMLWAIRAAVAPFVTNEDYLKEFKVVTGLIHDYRQDYEARVSS